MIRNEDNPPLRITGVKAEGNVYRAIFLAAAGERATGWPTAPTRSKRRSMTRPRCWPPCGWATPRDEARLGPETATPGVQAPARGLRDALNNPLLLGTLIAVLAAALGWALFRATQRINRLPKEP